MLGWKPAWSFLVLRCLCFIREQGQVWKSWGSTEKEKRSALVNSTLQITSTTVVTGITHRLGRRRSGEAADSDLWWRCRHYNQRRFQMHGATALSNIFSRIRAITNRLPFLDRFFHRQVIDSICALFPYPKKIPQRQMKMSPPSLSFVESKKSRVEQKKKKKNLDLSSNNQSPWRLRNGE